MTTSAEPLYAQAMQIRKQVLGVQHARYTANLNTLALLYWEMGKYPQAEPLYIQAMQIVKQVLGEQHPTYATSFNNLALLCESTSDYGRAEPLYIEMIRIRRQVLSEQHIDYAISLNNLAVLYQSMDDQARAEPLYTQAMQVYKQVLGEQHADYATSLNNLAAFYQAMGDYARAEPLHVEATQIWMQVLGEQHPDYASSLNNLATLYRSTGDYARAEPLYQEAVEHSLEHLSQTAYILSERQRMAMKQLLRHRLDNYLSCCLAGKSSAVTPMEHVVAWKGSVLVRQPGLRQASADPAIASHYRQLQSVVQRIAALLSAIPEPNEVDAWKAQLASLTDEKERLEAGLMQRSAAFREAGRKISLDRIRRAIPEDGVLVDYLEYSGANGRSLLASVILRESDPVMLDLDSAVEVGEKIDRWRESLGMTGDAKAAGQQLRAQLWEPLLEHLGEAKLILVSTDGGSAGCRY